MPRPKITAPGRDKLAGGESKTVKQVGTVP
jgi:hypothetical protein